MRKTILVLIVLLVGCQATPSVVSEDLQIVVDKAIEAKTPKVLNQATPYYSYYLPPHMGVRFSNRIASVLVSNTNEIVMSVDVPSIIMQRYYRDYLKNNMRVLQVSNSYYSFTGSFKDYNNETQNIEIRIDKEDDKFVILLHSNQFYLTSKTFYTDVSPMLHDMIIMLRSASANRNEIISEYSNKQEINYQRQIVDIFEQVAPDSGTLIDMHRLIKGEIDFSEVINPEIRIDELPERPESNEENDEESLSNGE